MATITVRKLTDEDVRDLRVAAAQRGVSMEQEARDRLRRAVHIGQHVHEVKAADGWNLTASLDDILALGVKPETPINHKAESDALYDYLDQT